MDRLRTLAVFKTVAEAGNFSRAAEQLQLSRALVTRAVMDLEEMLGVRLLQRSTRRMSITPLGQEVLDRASQVLTSYDDLKLLGAQRAAEPFGVVRVSAPTTFGHRLLGQALGSYLTLYPRVSIDLRLYDDGWGPSDEDFDLAICWQECLRGTFVARALAAFRVALYASSTYVARKGLPRDPAALASHACLALQGGPAWRLTQASTGSEHVAGVDRRLTCSSLEMLVTTACAGGGIAMLPQFVADDAVARGDLVRLLDGWDGEPLAMYLVYGSRRNQPMSVRTLIDHLLESVEARPLQTPDPVAAVGGLGYERMRSPALSLPE